MKTALVVLFALNALAHGQLTARDDFYYIGVNSPIRLCPLANDADYLVPAWFTWPHLGTMVPIDETFEFFYLPPRGYYGMDEMTYAVDGDRLTGRLIRTVHIWIGVDPADLNRDSAVDDLDLAVMLGNWRGTVSYARGNVWRIDTWDERETYGTVDDTDLAVLLATWNAAAPSGAAVPEPASVLLLATGLLAVMRKR